MAGSGLQKLFELMYAPNAVVHMLAGKALARAVRAHLKLLNLHSMPCCFLMR